MTWQGAVYRARLKCSVFNHSHVGPRTSRDKDAN
jgi:hypothetical protein